MERNRYTYLQAKAAEITSHMDGDPFEYLTDDVLEVVPFIQPDDSGSRDGAYVVEFLLECGGPTSRVETDSRWENTAKFWSTDGPEQGESYSYDYVELPSDIAASWHQLAENVVEMHR